MTMHSLPRSASKVHPGPPSTCGVTARPSLRGWPLVYRIVQIVVLGAVYFVLEVVAKSLVVLQLGFVFARGTPQAGLVRFATTLADWMAQLWCFVTFVSAVHRGRSRRGRLGTATTPPATPERSAGPRGNPSPPDLTAAGRSQAALER